ncbi:non-hydrolyzing UDP-N-acetylglucosamine 2-epimerase [Microbacterium sp. A204]|uniref:non-hydrolyzing UDP-N-acetylglucosamine 2-epimerase n=1 Tax=Microbacterium sp. A204 TaxID=3457321 RepID=UPI003FD28A54
MNSTQIALVMGTRPEMIKLAPLSKELGAQARVVHTGQHYDAQLSGKVMEALGMREPDVVLDGIGGRGRGQQIAGGITALLAEFEQNQPSVVVVQGDTNTVSAGAQAANYLDIPVVHVEAGLRSWDRGMPEEINRQVAGVLADVHCVATPENVQNLRAEGISDEIIARTGNTIVESVQDSLSAAERLGDGESAFSAASGQYVLSTIHRPENTDSVDALERVLRELSAIESQVLFVVHPRTRAAIERFGLDTLTTGLTMIDPVPHHELLALAKNATLLVSDSGGFQEECTVLKKPLLVVRRSTERPESMRAGFSRLVTPSQPLARQANALLSEPSHGLDDVPSPFGDGMASTRIATICRALDEGATAAEAVAVVDRAFT